jgi:hypothetical protein
MAASIVEILKRQALLKCMLMEMAARRTQNQMPKPGEGLAIFDMKLWALERGMQNGYNHQ